jgi:hypothetical protein
MTGARIDELVVRHHPRVYGTSKYGIMRTFSVLSDMMAIKMVTRFGSKPGLGFVVLALPFFLLGILSGGAWLAGIWILEQEMAIVFPSLALTFLYLSGHLFCLSILSEMFLANAKREYSHRLAAVLTVERKHTELTEPGV